MALNFSRQNLKGRSFEGLDLTDADFSYAQIQGANFSRAVLARANFTGAKAGVSRWAASFVCALAGLSGLLVGAYGTLVADTINQDYLAFFGPRDAAIAGCVCLVFSCVLITKDLMNAIVVTLLCGLFTWLTFLIWEYVHTGNLLSALVGSESITVDVMTMVVIFWTGISAVTLLCSTVLVSARMQRPTQHFFAITEYVAGGCAFLVVGLAGMKLPGAIAQFAAWAITAILCALILNSRRQTIAEHPRHQWLRSVALTLANFGGTQFQSAQLSHTNFTQAKLNAANFSDASLAAPCFRQAQFLNCALTNRTILQPASVRRLLITGRGKGQSYVRCDLRGAYLAGATLDGADFTGADISQADFTAAQMVKVNLARTQALGTCFHRANLTGSCIESWNINIATQIDEVICDYIYLLQNQQERRPSHGHFEPGDFTQLFQDVLHTVDLIFREGLNISAFMSAFQQVQAQCADHEVLSVRSIENKGNGVVVVRVEVPEEADKPQLQTSFTAEYTQALKRLEERYTAELAAKDEQITIYREHQNELSKLTQLLTQQHHSRTREHVCSEGRSEDGQSNKSLDQAQDISAQGGQAKRAVLRLSHTSAHQIAVALQIGDENAPPELETAGALPAADEVLSAFSMWQSLYQQTLQHTVRLSAPTAQVNNINYGKLKSLCAQAANNLEIAINNWFSTASFRPVSETLMTMLSPTDTIRLVLQTDHATIRALPLHLWSWFERYPKAELVLSEPTYQLTRPLPISSPASTENSGGNGKVRLLAILGDSDGLDVEGDRTYLTELSDVSLTCLVEPNRAQLNDHLWEQPWDVLFFAGHSTCQNNQQQIQLNSAEGITLYELKYALRKATECGLKLAIFNACDGLQLIQKLGGSVPLPPTIVMRYPVPDAVAQAFLKHFMAAFSQQRPLHLAVREARERLQGLESQFPFATWLPVLSQNPAAAPLTWSALKDT
ncbi:MAG: pentapeptide repeat-containing protein [Cyanobacteria bacterium P01_D01_bin.105]